MDKNIIYSDEELIKSFQHGNEKAFRELVIRYRDKLLNFVLRFVGQEEMAEDIVQDTFIKLYTSADMYREIAKFSTWIYTIAANLAKTELRKRKRRKLFSLQDLGLDEKEYEIPSTDTDPGKELNTRFSRGEITRAIYKLSEQFRTVIILRDVQELSYEEISRIVDVPEGTVKSRINRGRLKLIQSLKGLE
ncbi:MAG: sigma-70 family RNA polymerase sigma factor [Candidatus Marinimicrobia bacterium]|nr:sigma-70 family RNA polymerase sigma factor [Candidatus Neomarinimicrobiota bacterium]